MIPGLAVKRHERLQDLAIPAVLLLGGARAPRARGGSGRPSRERWPRRRRSGPARAEPSPPARARRGPRAAVSAERGLRPSAWCRPASPGAAARPRRSTASASCPFPCTPIEVGQVRVRRRRSAGTRSRAIRYSRSARGRSPRSVASSARLRCASARSASTASDRSYSASAASKAARSPPRHLLFRHRGQRPRRVDADREDRVPQKRRREGQPLRGRKPAHRLEGSVAHERLGVGQGPDERLAAAGECVPAEERRGRGAPDRRPGSDLRRARREPPRLPRLLAAGVDRLAVRRLAQRPIPPPCLRRVGGPAVGPVAVALRAGVGGADRDRQVRARHAEAVVVPGGRPCSRASACGSAMQLRAGRAGRVEVVRRRFRTSPAAWQPAQTRSPRPRTFRPCGSWQSEQLTPAAYILLCRNEPYS